MNRLLAPWGKVKTTRSKKAALELFCSFSGSSVDSKQGGSNNQRINIR